MLPAHLQTALLTISHRYGADPAFVLAGGGNTSAKTDDRLWVKASGHALATIAWEGFVELDRSKLQAMLEAEWPADPVAREAEFLQRLLDARVAPERGQRPSVESLLHHLLPFPLVAHTHPGLLNALACCTDGQWLAASLFADRVLWQRYVDPGLILAQSLRESLVRHPRRPAAILLQNHGLIVSGESVEAITAVTDELVSTVQQQVNRAAEPADPTNQHLLSTHARAASLMRPGLSVAIDDSAPVRWLAGTAEGRRAVLAGPLTPDQIVYCRSMPLVIEAPARELDDAAEQWRRAASAYQATYGFAPWVGLIAGAGMVAARESAKMAEITRSLYVDAAAVYGNASRLGGAHPLNARDRRFIETWEVEAHRRSVMSSSTRETT